MDEFEAIRLADFVRVSQKKAAKSMNISQQTFSRILKGARKSIAGAIVKGSIIKIHGGRYLISSHRDSV